MFVINNMMMDDNKLHKVLSALAGLVISMDVPRPVANAVVSQGKVKAATPATTKKEAFVEALAAYKNDSIGMEEMRTIWTGLGGGRASINSALLTDLTKERVIKRKSRGIYRVL